MQQDSGLLPSTSDRDAMHISLATVHEMDILLSWNCRHIANAAIQARLRILVEKSAFTLPVLCTLEELMENDNEQNDRHSARTIGRRRVGRVVSAHPGSTLAGKRKALANLSRHRRLS
jgi:hypothetical protein